MKRVDVVENIFAVVVALPCFAGFIAAVWVVLYQAATWFKTAVWPPLTVLDGLSWWKGGRLQFESSGALGLDQIVLWYLSQPLAIALFLTAAAYMLAGVYVLDRCALKQ